MPNGSGGRRGGAPGGGNGDEDDGGGGEAANGDGADGNGGSGDEEGGSREGSMDGSMDGDGGGSYDANAFVANAAMHGDSFSWHVDADPSTFPPSPWTRAYGQYVNRVSLRARALRTGNGAYIIYDPCL